MNAPSFEREEFIGLLNRAREVQVIVQVSHALQRSVPISKGAALDIGLDALKFGPVWGIYNYHDEIMEIGLTSQWHKALGAVQ